MIKHFENSLSQMYEQSFNEMYVLNTMINMIKQSCEEKENKSMYYGTNYETIKNISNERNDYINMLAVVSDKISNIMSLFLSMEREIALYKDSNNCCR